MNISVVEQKEGFVRFQVDVEKDDYQEAYKKELKKVAQGANIKGFRAGKAPVGMIEKMFGEGVRLETINRLVADLIDGFIKEKDYKAIGWAMPEEENGQEMVKDDMTLYFKLALYPSEYDTNFDDKTFTKYEVIISDEEVNKQLEAMQNAQANLKEIDTVEEDAIVGGDIAELEGDTRKEGGILKENVTIYPQFMKDKEEQCKFINAEKGSIVVFNPYKAFEGNASELTSLLGIEKDEVESLKDKEFSFQIETIRHMVAAELNQEFFNQVFGEDQVHNEEEAKAKLRELIQSSENGNAEYKFTQDFMEYVKSEKSPKLVLADDLIIEWFHDNYKSQYGEDEAPKEDVVTDDLIASLKREMYIMELARMENLEVHDEDIKNFAYEMVRSQFSQMGWYNPSHEIVEQYAGQRLKDSNFAYSVKMNILEQKVGRAMLDKVKVETKQVTVEELHKILNPATNAEEATEEAEASDATATEEVNKGK